MSEETKKSTVIMPGSTPEEILATVAKDGIELSDEELEQVTGGASWLDPDPEVICGYCRKQFPIKNGQLSVECPNCHRTIYPNWD